MWNLKYDTNELIYRTDSQTQRTDLWLPRGRVLGEGCIGSLGLADINYYMYVKLNQFAVHQKLTQHHKPTIPQLKKNTLSLSLIYFLKDFLPVRLRNSFLTVRLHMYIFV